MIWSWYLGCRANVSQYGFCIFHSVDCLLISRVQIDLNDPIIADSDHGFGEIHSFGLCFHGLSAVGTMHCVVLVSLFSSFVFRGRPGGSSLRSSRSSDMINNICTWFGMTTYSWISTCGKWSGIDRRYWSTIFHRSFNCIYGGRPEVSSLQQTSPK